MILPWVDHDAHADVFFWLMLPFFSSAAVLGITTAAFGCIALPPGVLNIITVISPFEDSPSVDFGCGFGAQAYSANTPSFSARIQVGLNGPKSRAPARKIVMFR